MDYALKLKPYDESGQFCGDAGFFRENERTCLLAHIDALGHGLQADSAARKALALLESTDLENDVDDILFRLHENLKGTVGVVAALMRLDKTTGKLVLTGIGNIRVLVTGSIEQSVPLRDGVIGYSKIHPKQSVLNIYPGDVLVFTSDGIREHFRKEEYPGLHSGDAETIAGNYIRELSREGDDSSCSVLRYCL